MPKNDVFFSLLKQRHSQNKRKFKRIMAQAEAGGVSILNHNSPVSESNFEEREKLAGTKKLEKHAPFTLEEVLVSTFDSRC